VEDGMAVTDKISLRCSVALVVLRVPPLAGEKTSSVIYLAWRNSGSRPDSQPADERADSGTRSLTPTAAHRRRPRKLFRPDIFRVHSRRCE
jgi:hypothetical protein